MVNSVSECATYKRNRVCLLVFAGSLSLLGSCRHFTRLYSARTLFDCLSSSSIAVSGCAGRLTQTRRLVPSYHVPPQETLELASPAISAGVTASAAPHDDWPVPSISLTCSPEIIGISLLRDGCPPRRANEC